MRTGIWRRILAAIFLLGVAPAFADEVQVLQGTHDDEPYRIDTPAHWNGGLVMFVHGYGGEGTARGGVEYPRIGDVALKGNYAWAGSGYRSQGYHPDLFLADTIALREMFIQKFGRPRWTILYGESMGGHMVVAGLERHSDLFQATGEDLWVTSRSSASGERNPSPSPMRLDGDVRAELNAINTCGWLR